MRLKMFIWHNPTTEMPEKVYEFPWSDANILEIITHGKEMFSSEPMQRPVFSVMPFHLTEIKNQRYTVQQEDYKQKNESQSEVQHLDSLTDPYFKQKLQNQQAREQESQM
jgi:hypothetical protein